MTSNFVFINGGFVLKNLSWLIIPSLVLAVSVLADTPVNNGNKAIKASYDFNLNVAELDQAEAMVMHCPEGFTHQADPISGPWRRAVVRITVAESHRIYAVFRQHCNFAL